MLFKIVADRVFAFGMRLRKGDLVEGARWAVLGNAVLEVPEPAPVPPEPAQPTELPQAPITPRVEVVVRPSDLDGTADKVEAPKARKSKKKTE